MENTKSPSDTLFGDSLPRLLSSMSEYFDLAIPLCSPAQIQLLSELSRRLMQCDLLLRSTYEIEQRQISAVMTLFATVVKNQPDADSQFSASCQDIDAMWLLTESFYWVAHKAILIITGDHKCFTGKKLPKLPGSFPFGGVGNVRNHFIEHPFDYNNQFGLGGMWCGPILNGGLGKDSKGAEKKDLGLYFNAIEWADTTSKILLKASKELKTQ